MALSTTLGMAKRRQTLYFPSVLLGTETMEGAFFISRPLSAVKSAQPLWTSLLETLVSPRYLLALAASEMPPL